MKRSKVKRQRAKGKGQKAKVIRRRRVAACFFYARLGGTVAGLWRPDREVGGCAAADVDRTNESEISCCGAGWPSALIMRRHRRRNRNRILSTSCRLL